MTAPGMTEEILLGTVAWLALLLAMLGIIVPCAVIEAGYLVAGFIGWLGHRGRR